jgi:hypothetical protein
VLLSPGFKLPGSKGPLNLNLKFKSLSESELDSESELESEGDSEMRPPGEGIKLPSTERCLASRGPRERPGGRRRAMLAQASFQVGHSGIGPEPDRASYYLKQI